MANETRVDEIAAGIHRLSTFVPGTAGPAGLQFNQFLIDADQPMLFHTGQRSLFPGVSAAVARIMPLERLRWIGFSHIESDECGALNEWLAAAPAATAMHSRLGCNIWLNEWAARPPRAMVDDERLDLGGKVVRWLATPHLPHGWDAGVVFEETTATLFPSDLFTQAGDPAATTGGDILDPSLAVEKSFGFTSVTPTAPSTTRRLADLAPRAIAAMHGSSFLGDGAATLRGLADFYAGRLRAAAV
ncbi:MAG: MBL fold metallo-hydrolase [Rhodospirillales bacterium]|nr:MAG: MBL fold metallo-hydrolase [Rhodospirillales bacterium]